MDRAGGNNSRSGSGGQGFPLNTGTDACAHSTYFFGLTKIASSTGTLCFTSVSLKVKCIS